MMNILKRMGFVSMIIISCSCGDNSDSPGLKVILASEDITMSGVKGATIIQPLEAVVFDETNDTEVPDIDVTFTSSVPPPAVVLRSAEETSASSSLVVTTDGLGSALCYVEVTVDEEREIVITANIGSSTDSMIITVEPL
jgi:hypothetical protein